MKTFLKSIITLILVSVLLSCNEQVTISKEEYKKLKKDTLQNEYPKPFKLYTEGLEYGNSDGIVLGSDKHEYLVTDYGRNSSNVQHYIDCKLCNERSNNIKKNDTR